MSSQTDQLLVTVFATSIVLCVYIASMSDGDRAYAAMLCGITIGLIAIQQIDTPHMAFTVGQARGAAPVIGFLSIAIVHDALSSPDGRFSRRVSGRA